MKIVLCGSMSFYSEMLRIRDELAHMGHEVTVPKPSSEMQVEGAAAEEHRESARLKIAYDLIREHYENIKAADVILVVNSDKNGVANYIGGNAFLEMGFAFVLEKPIFLLNPIPDLELTRDEMIAMQPIVLNGDPGELEKHLPG